MVNYFIYAKDFSGSTEKVKYYHKNGLQSLMQFKSDVNKKKSELSNLEDSRIVYLHWGQTCVEVDERTTIEKYKEQCGDDGATLPETIIKWIKAKVKSEDKIKLLYIITDGLIESCSINKCLKLNEHVDYENVVFHGIHENLECIDLSVAVTFLKSHCKIYRNNELLDEFDISEEYDYSKITIENFVTEKDLLVSYIKFKFINSKKSNSAALTEIDKLKGLRNRLFSTLSSKTYNNLDTTNKDTFLSEFKKSNWYKNLTNPSCDLKIDIEKSISALINYITSNKKSYAFDALKFETNFRYEVPEEDIVDLNFTTDQEIKFPDIILDDEKGIPVILLTEMNLLDKILFSNSETTASFSKFKSKMECPLSLMNDPDLNESIGYFYTLNVYKHLLEKTTKTEPRTRRPFHGGLVLVDTDDFDKYNDYILSATYFHFKKVKYNIGLFYFVLWKICETKEWMDKNVVKQFKKYMVRRISTTICRIGLSSLPLDPSMKCSLPSALWYCVELSSCIFKDDPKHFAHERLRMYYGVASYMMEILKCLQYDLDLDFIHKRRDLIRHVMILKKIPTQRDKVFYLAEKIFKSVNGFLISEIKNASNVKKLNYLKLNHKELLSDEIIKQKVDMTKYVHFLYHIDDSAVKICETTLRPYFMIDKDTSFYRELYKKGKKVVISEVGGEVSVNYDEIDKLEFRKILSFYNLFLHCVKDEEKFPTINEYMEFILRKRKFQDDFVTIFPVNVLQGIEGAFQRYESLIKSVSVEEFLKISKKYVNRIERMKAENKRKFDTDDEIQEFLEKEEHLFQL